MIAPLSGGCACGSIRYVCARAPIAMLNCHCGDCQRSSGAPFASGFIVSVADVEITGSPTTYSVRAGSGSLATRSFCPRLWHPSIHARRNCSRIHVHSLPHARQSVRVSANAGHLDF
jgi:hypothetical protein